MPWYWSHSLSIIILSYLLVFVQLTWQVDNGWFTPVFDDFFMEFINIGPAYIRGWVGGYGSWVGGGKSLNKEEEYANFRV